MKRQEWFKRAPVGENEQGLTEDTKSASSPTTSQSPRVRGKCAESASPRVRVLLGGQEAKTADTLRASARLSEKDKSDRRCRDEMKDADGAQETEGLPEAGEVVPCYTGESWKSKDCAE